MLEFDEKIYSFYKQLLNRFGYEKDFYNKKTLENMILNLHDYLKDDHPYIYHEIYANKEYEKWTEKNAFKIDHDYQGFVDRNHDYLMGIVNNFANLTPYDEVPTDTYVYDDYEIIKRFFIEEDPELYELFKSLINNNIFRIKKSGYGTAYYDKACDAHYIMIGKEHNFDNMVALVHEMGHVYRNYLKKERHSSYDYELTIRSEISSEALELKFLNFLINNGIYEIDAQNYLNKYKNNIINDSKKLYDNHFHDGLSIAKYLFGRLLSYYYINNNISFKDFINYIHSNNLLTILNELNLDYQNISDEIKKSYCLKKQ